MKEVQINSKCKLREDGRMFNIKTGEEVFVKQHHGHELPVRYFGKMTTISSLVMELFGTPKPGKDYMIIHENNNLLDNRIDNLKWGTRSEAMRRRKDARPVGYRQCDFTDKTAYYKEYYNSIKEAEGYHEYHIERCKLWRKNNPDKVKLRKLRYALTHSEKIKEQKNRNNEKHPERKEYHSNYSKEWAKNNRDKRCTSAKVYYTNHSVEVKAKAFNKREEHKNEIERNTD
jgi:hypothetical protein